MKIAFVIPWYGKDIPGGAETECRRTALHLKEAGCEVKILTTCVKNFHSDWNVNYHPEGNTEEEGLEVRRFKVRKRDTARFDAINYILMNTDVINLKGYSPLSREEERIYIEEMINSPNLYDYIDKEKDIYDYFLFIPYMYGTTYFGSKICTEKSILIPCLHNESYAYMNIYREMFNKVKCIIFHTRSEENLARELYKIEDSKSYLIGEGIDTDFNFDRDRFRKKYQIDTPFILYAGRKDQTKNTPLLIRYFSQYLEKNDKHVKLILIGSGKVDIPLEYKDNIIDLGYIPIQDKYDAYDASEILCQPSLNESFSIVIMESWLTSTSVLVHNDCEVTREHCIESNGGLFFRNYPEFEECVNFYISYPEINKKLGDCGKKYVNNNFTWGIITNKYLNLFNTIKKGIQKPIINIMTSTFVKGDAIGNYIKSLDKLFSKFGYRVKIFADRGDTSENFMYSSEYRLTGKDILWFHYSIYSDNLKYIKKSNDFKIMDYHGVSPSILFKGYNKTLESKTLESFTKMGKKMLKKYVNDFDLCIVHSDYMYNELKKLKYKNIIKYPLIVNEDVFKEREDKNLSKLLSKIDYILFIGRIVPQKDIISIVKLFAELKKSKNEINLFLVGDTNITIEYTKKIYDLIKSLGLEKYIMLTGKIIDPHLLVSFFKHAKFSVIMSEWESFCAPIVESMFFNVPVIGINKPCIPETIGNAGLVLDNLDDIKGAEQICDIWNNEEKYKQLQKNCEERVLLYTEDKLELALKNILYNYIKV